MPEQPKPTRESQKRARRLKQASERALHELSETFVSGAHQVAVESDGWFMATVAGLDKGAQHTKQAVEKLGRYVLRGTSKLKPGWASKKSPRVRIREMLQREAKRSKLANQDFDAFSEQIATIVELVLVGRVSVTDIAFEADERTRLLDRDPNPSNPPVPNHANGGNGSEGPASAQ